MKLPQTGEISSYSLVEACGSVRLEDGSELRFGAASLCGVVPALGVRVIVTRVAPDPAGGFKATVIASAEHDDPEYRARLAEFERADAEDIEAIRARRERDAGT